MPYEQEISRPHPTVLLFLVDQSGSMAGVMSSGRTKSQQVADVLNKTLATLIQACRKRESGIRDYFEIGVIGYGANGAHNGFQGALGSRVLSPISAIEATTLRVDSRTKEMVDDVGNVVELPVKFPVWFEPEADGGTPMCQAITMAAEELVAWCDSHPESYPPTVLHITDGESTDGDPEELASQLRQIRTDDGHVLMFNLHLSSSGGDAVEFPASPSGLPDDYARLLFRMSSTFPAHVAEFAQTQGFNLSAESRGFMFNADAVQVAKFFDIGTKSAQLD